jgi:hypothetical protein
VNDSGDASADYRAAAAKTRAWLDEHFDSEGRCVLDVPDGSGSADARYYYKAPYLLALAGLRTKGARVAKFVLKRLVDQKGNLTGPPGFGLDQRVYGMGWLTYGAVATERFDLSSILAGRLEEMQDQRCGGWVLPDADAGEEVAEVCFSAGAGMGLVAAGRLDASRLIVDRLVTMLNVQPDPNRFYNRFRRDGSLIAHPAAAEWQKMYDVTLEEQRPANFATVVLALVWFARATGATQYLEAANRYVDLVYRHRLDPAQFGRASKFGYAMLQLYEETGNPQLLDRVRHFGNVLVQLQSEDGLWDPRPKVNRPVAPHERFAAAADCACTIFGLAGLP